MWEGIVAWIKVRLGEGSTIRGLINVLAGVGLTDISQSSVDIITTPMNNESMLFIAGVFIIKGVFGIFWPEKK